MLAATSLLTTACVPADAPSPSAAEGLATGASEGGPRRILYESVIDDQSEVMLINEDGTALTRVTDNPAYDGMSSWTPDGEILFVSNRAHDGQDREGEGRGGDVYLMAADGSDIRRITTDAAGYSFLQLSPDGRWIGFDASRRGEFAQVWVMGVDGDGVRQVSPSEFDEGYVSWTADSRALVYDSFRDGPPEIYRGSIETGEVTRLTHLEAHIGDPRMSPDGSLLSLESGRDGDPEIYVTNSDGSQPRRLTHNPADDRAPAISHDNQRVVFSSDRDGEREGFEVWVMDIDGSNLQKLTSTSTSNLYATFEPPAARQGAGATSNAGYEELVALSDAFREFVDPPLIDGVPNYGAAAMREQQSELEAFRSRLAAFDVARWTVAAQVDLRVLGAEINALDFYHRVLRPWSRDPSFYLQSQAGQRPSRVGALAIPSEWPLTGATLEEFTLKLRAVPAIFAQAQRNFGDLANVAGDLTMLALHNFDEEVAIFRDLTGNLKEHHPELVSDLHQASQAVGGYRSWLEANHASMTAHAGIGKNNYNWWFKNVQLVPYTWDDLMTIAQSEYERSVAALKLEEHRNRHLPPLVPAATVEEYNRRWRAGEVEITHFLRDSDIFTVPDYLEPIGPGVWWSSPENRASNPDAVGDFFEQNRDRNPLPELAHNMVGHNLDSLRHQRDYRPLRGQARRYELDMVRSEGLAFGLEEMLMHAGLLDSVPRARELVYIAAAFRSVRSMADLRMHANEISLTEANRFCFEQTPYQWMVEDGHEVWFEMETTLRTPGWHTGMVPGKHQLIELMQERGSQLGKQFVLRDFMDELFASGLIPISLIRWEMTGRDDAIPIAEGF